VQYSDIFSKEQNHIVQQTQVFNITKCLKTF